MSELTNKTSGGPAFRYWLLATVSAFVLTGPAAQAHDDSDRPTVWIEVGGQLERMEAGREAFAPDFTGQFESDSYLLPDKVQKVSRYGNGFEGKIEIDPEGSDWSLAASLRYGRSNSSAMSHNQVPTAPHFKVQVSVPVLNLHLTQYPTGHAIRFADARSRADESHLLMDFQAGRDVGVGAFKSAKFDFGVRIAQFQSRSSVHMTADSGSDVQYTTATHFGPFPAYVRKPDLAHETWDLYHATALISRSFKGIGPSLAFDDSVGLLGNPDTMRVNFDFGANGAVLFGRQKDTIQHKTKDERPVLPITGNFVPLTVYYQHAVDTVRARSVIVPNIGGFAGLSFNYANAKLKLGYRADFFFGAMDGGIDTRKTYDRNFYGPFATISIGLGG